MDQYINPLYASFARENQMVLRPIASMRIVKLWKSLYCRWKPCMNPQSKLDRRTRELLSLQEQLIKEINEKRSKTNYRQTHSQPLNRLASPNH